jgi:hypothetical protein
MTRPGSFLIAVILAAAVPAATLHAVTTAEADAGRALVKRYADAVVSVELVVTLKIKAGDREMPARETRMEVNGTVLTADGLTVTSLARVDPQAEFDAMRATNPGGRGVELVGADFKEVKLRFADGSEAPAKFVLKDADLDLAFMAPDMSAGATKREFAHVSLDNAAEGVVLGEYFYVTRAPKNLRRVPLVRATEIMGLVEKPRRFYLMTDLSLGAPVFDAGGKLLGITLQNISNGVRNLIVLPSGDVADSAKQAQAAQVADVKAAETKASEKSATTDTKPAASSDTTDKK